MILYNALTVSIIVIYILAALVDSMQQEGDYVVDGVLLLILGYMWMT